MSIKMSDQKLLDSVEAAVYIGCAVSTLHQSRCTGALFGMTAPPFIKRGQHGRVFYKSSTLEKFLSQFKERANTAAA